MATKIYIERYLKYAEIANAAYAFEIIYKDSSITLEDALILERGFSNDQAIEYKGTGNI